MVTTLVGMASQRVARVIDSLIEASVVGSFSRLGPPTRERLFAWDDAPAESLDGRTALVTGATSGIGAALASDLVDLGATVHLVGRDEHRLRELAAQLRSRHPGATVVEHRVDFGHLAEVRRLAEALKEMCTHLDVLAHVAGALVHDRHLTGDGIELTVQVHVAAPFLLTTELLPLLKASGDARVITMSSGGMYTERLDLDDLIRPQGTFDGTTAYARAKRAQVELNAAWAQRHPCAGIGFHAMHPGWVDTPGLRAGLPGFAKRLAPVLRTPRQGADTATWLAWTPEATAPGGLFWLDRQPRHTIALPWTRTPDGEVDRVWDAISHLVGVASTAHSSGPSAAGRRRAGAR